MAAREFQYGSHSGDLYRRDRRDPQKSWIPFQTVIHKTVATSAKKKLTGGCK